MEVTLAPTQLDASWATSVLWFKNIQMLYIVQILQLSNWCYLPENCILITMIDKMQEHTMKRKKIILWISWHSRKISRMVFKQWSNVHTYSTNVLYQASYHHEAYDRQNMLYNLLQDGPGCTEDVAEAAQHPAVPTAGLLPCWQQLQTNLVTNLDLNRQRLLTPHFSLLCLIHCSEPRFSNS